MIVTLYFVYIYIYTYVNVVYACISYVWLLDDISINQQPGSHRGAGAGPDRFGGTGSTLDDSTTRRLIWMILVVCQEWVILLYLKVYQLFSMVCHGLFCVDCSLLQLFQRVVWSGYRLQQDVPAVQILRWHAATSSAQLPFKFIDEGTWWIEAPIWFQ